MNRRSFLSRLAALLASVPLLRLRGEAKAAGATGQADGPQTAYLRAALEHGPLVARVGRRNGKVYGYEYRRDIDAHWIEGDICVECDVPLDKCIYAMPLKATPPRDGGWM